MVRITTEIVENAPQFTNAIKDRELDLHGYKFQAIENLGATLDQFDTIDLSANEFRKLDGFPLLKRVKCLILSNNKIMRVAEDLSQNVPNIDTLILTSNNFTDLRELDPLAQLHKLTFLSLLHCPVTMRSNYRPYVVSLLPSLRFLDYKRVTQSDRKIAYTLFKRPSLSAGKSTNTATASGSGQRTGTVSGSVKTFVPGAPLHQSTTPPPVVNGSETGSTVEAAQANSVSGDSAMLPGGKRPGGSTQDLYAIQEAIKRARTMDEVDRLHHLLSSGQFAGFAVQWQQHLRRQQQEKQQQQMQQQQQRQPVDLEDHVGSVTQPDAEEKAADVGQQVVGSSPAMPMDVEQQSAEIAVGQVDVDASAVEGSEDRDESRPPVAPVAD